MSVIISEELAGALLTLLDTGTFSQFQFGQVNAVYVDLMRAVNDAGVDVEIVPGDVAVAEVVDDFPAGEV